MGIPGYHGQFLRVDVGTGGGLSVPLEENFLRRTIGGSGLGVGLLLRENSAGMQALSAAAPLVFAFSPLVGSPLTTSAKFAVVSKSPLTERINDSLASSGFALAGRRTGHDAIMLVGRAAEPSIVVIDDGHVRLEAADEIWGMTPGDAQQRLKQRFGSDYQTAVIGSAGERGVHYATISHDGRHAGRGGSGAVMGSKNIKAICVRGTRRCDWAQPERLVELAREISRKSFGPATAKYRELGTATNLLTFNRLNVLPVRNFQQGSFEGAERISPEQLGEVRERTRASCAACTIGCEHLYSLQDGKGSVRLEYENLFALGPLCGISDPEVVLAASRRCDELGIDTISAGGTIAFAMECAELGYLDAPWLRFGDGSGLLRALDLIGGDSQDPGNREYPGNREHPGDAELGRLLRLGSRRMAIEVGHNSIRFAPQVKGLEIPGYDPRGLQTMALGFAVGSRGADHNRSGAYEVDFSSAVDRRNPGAGAALLAIETEDRAALMDSLILCKFLRGIFVDFFEESAEILRLVTGWDVNADELRATARDLVTRKKRYNILAGWTPDEDTLPERILRQPLPEDSLSSLSAERLAEMIRVYNLGRGWTAEGWLTENEGSAEIHC